MGSKCKHPPTDVGQPSKGPTRQKLGRAEVDCGNTRVDEKEAVFPLTKETQDRCKAHILKPTTAPECEGIIPSGLSKHQSARCSAMQSAAARAHCAN